jgi:hypothetical protein
VLGALQPQAFFRTFDGTRTTNLDERRLFENLRNMLGEPAEAALQRQQPVGGHWAGNPGDAIDAKEDLQASLTDAQLAQLVGDIGVAVHAPYGEPPDGGITLEDFCTLEEGDEVRLMTLIELYQTKPGDHKMLRTLQKEIARTELAGGESLFPPTRSIPRPPPRSSGAPQGAPPPACRQDSDFI